MKKRRIILITCAIAFVAILLIGGFILHRSADQTAYEQLVRDGYTGTQEQLIASLVGELSNANDGHDTAYDRACSLGYGASRKMWIKTLTGLKAADESAAVYELVCENGYQGTLSAWLEGLVPHPEQLGKSSNEQATEYEIACQYGFEGSFTQWLIALVGYQENN